MLGLLRSAEVFFVERLTFFGIKDVRQRNDSMRSRELFVRVSAVRLFLWCHQSTTEEREVTTGKCFS